MIEFKAECGHTVRAKDENAGGVVRCSYCGREVPVPDEHNDDLDFLFKDIEPSDEGAVVGRRRRRRRGIKGLFGAAARRKKPGTFDPFGVVLKLCYAAFLIVVVIVVGRKFVVPLFKEGGLARRLRGVSVFQSKPDEPLKSKKTRGEPREDQRLGLIGQKDLRGRLYIASTPPGASAYYMKAEDAKTAGPLLTRAGVNRVATGRTVGDGRWDNNASYVVDVVFAINDPALKQFKDYRTFRRAVEEGTAEKRNELMRDYFLPDDAAALFVHEAEGQMFLIRQYRNVQVPKERSQGVRALFLPRITKDATGAFYVEQIVKDYIPATQQYRFDEVNVDDELDYWKVSPADRPWVLEALKRIGIMPYSVAGRSETRLFKIAIEDGSFWAPVIGEAGG